MISMDMYGKKPELRLPSGATSYNTATGCICTLLMLVLVLGFGALSLIESIERSNVLAVHEIEEGYFDSLVKAEIDKSA